MKRNKKGFTLVELLVVVLIIGVLAAIALPMYQKAVLKSRFSALMPIVKSMNDSNEAYYLEHGNYATDPQSLPVQGKLEYPTGTELEFGNNIEYAYVLASNPSAKNNYIMYQKHSENYPGEIHCEALEGDSLAEYVCESFGATQNIGNTLTEGYTTYVLSGTGAGFPLALLNLPTCDAATAMGYTCNITTNEQGKQVKQICTTLGTSNNYCRSRTYNKDGSYTSVTCQITSGGVCNTNWRSATYDANGNQLTERFCSTVDSSGNCTAYNTDRSYDYTYDANGNMLRQKECHLSDDSGKCTFYSYNYSYDYTYDENGNQLTQRKCGAMDTSTGACTAYSTAEAYDYTYDANGNQLMQRQCSSSGIDQNSGVCTAYSNTYNYAYDANGNQLTQWACSSVDSSGKCTAYGITYNYTYDANGNKLAERKCSSVDSSGKCTAYYYGYYYTYDENGNQLTKQECYSVNSSTGNCTVYSQYNGTSYRYTYDDNGKQLAEQSCSGSFRNTSTGDCTVYNQTYIQTK